MNLGTFRNAGPSRAVKLALRVFAVRTNPLLSRNKTVTGSLIVLLVASLTTWSLAQQETRPDEPAQQLEQFEQLSRSLDRIDWNEEASHVRRSIENVWVQQGWTDESDLFAREVAIGLAEIPPWKPIERIEYAVNRYADRYNASPELRSRMKSAAIREVSGLLMRHADKIMAQAQEYLELRAAGEPFTPELVARWMQEGKPIFDDMNNSVDRITREIRPAISPGRLLDFDRDRLTHAKRRNDIEIAMQRWIGGQWSPAEWGLQNDPIHSGGHGEHSTIHQPRANLFQTLLPTKATQTCVAHNPDTWKVCVTEFARQYDLDPAQRTSANSILAELTAWARDHQQTHRERLDAVPPALHATDEAYEPIRKAFMALQLRLDALPTSAQRERIHSLHAAIQRDIQDRAMNEDPPPE